MKTVTLVLSTITFIFLSLGICTGQSNDTFNISYTEIDSGHEMYKDSIQLHFDLSKELEEPYSKLKTFKAIKRYNWLLLVFVGIIIVVFTFIKLRE